MGVKKDELMDKTLQRNRNLDYAKALAISLVVFWHLHPIRILETEKSTILTKIFKFGLTQFNLQVTLVAVPLFLLVSLYLFYQKIEARPVEYMKKRCLGIGGAFLFWTVCQFACFYGIVIIISVYNGASYFPATIPAAIPIHRLLMEGGPPLPVVGGSVFYFLFVLLILVLVSTIFYAFRNAVKIFPLIGITVVIVSILYFEILNLKGQGLPYWRVDNFLIYIPLSYFILRQENRKLRRIIPLFYMGFIFFSAQDVFLRHQGYSCGAYSRVSIVCGSIAIFSSILQLKGLKKLTVISLLSKYSLGIFATHKYWYLFVIVVFQYCGLSDPVSAVNFPLDLWALIIVFISISLTFVGVLFAEKTLIKRFIM